MIHSFLVHPGRGSGISPQIKGANVPLQGKLFELLDGIYDASEQECDIDIVFRPASDGSQNNEARDLLLRHLKSPNLNAGRHIAERLGAFTDRRSGLGLLFVIAGTEGRSHKLILSRFPTDSAILADENQGALTIAFLERVFMKSKTSYKAVMYSGSSFRGDFREGRAVDKQIGASAGETSNYWIADFLASSFKLTGAQGTRRMATAIREAARKSDLPVKQELVAAATLASNLGGQQISIADFEQRYSLSQDARQAVRNELANSRIADERFRFDVSEFGNIVRYRSVEMDNGGVLTAPAGEFDHVFQKDVLDEERGDVRFSTRGKIRDEKLKKVQ